MVSTTQLLRRAVAKSGGEPTGNSDASLWTQVLTGKEPIGGLKDLLESGVLADEFPEIHAMVGFGGPGQGHKDLWDHTVRVVAQAKNRPLIRWAALFHDVGKPVSFSKVAGKVTFHHHEAASSRLFTLAMSRTGYLTGDERQKVSFLVRHLGLVEAYLPDWTDSAVRRLHKKLGPHFEDCLLLARADCTSKHLHKRNRYQAHVHELRERALELAAQDAVVPPLPKGLGGALMTVFGVPPSKKLGDIKKALEARVEAGEVEPYQSVDFYVTYLSAHRGDFGL